MFTFSNYSILGNVSGLEFTYHCETISEIHAKIDLTNSRMDCLISRNKILIIEKINLSQNFI